MRAVVPVGYSTVIAFVLVYPESHRIAPFGFAIFRIRHSSYIISRRLRLQPKAYPPLAVRPGGLGVAGLAGGRFCGVGGEYGA